MIGIASFGEDVRLTIAPYEHYECPYGVTYCCRRPYLFKTATNPLQSNQAPMNKLACSSSRPVSSCPTSLEL